MARCVTRARDPPVPNGGRLIVLLSIIDVISNGMVIYAALKQSPNVFSPVKSRVTHATGSNQAVEIGGKLPTQKYDF